VSADRSADPDENDDPGQLGRISKTARMSGGGVQGGVEISPENRRRYSSDHSTEVS